MDNSKDVNNNDNNKEETKEQSKVEDQWLVGNVEITHLKNDEKMNYFCRYGDVLYTMKNIVIALLFEPDFTNILFMENP